MVTQKRGEGMLRNLFAASVTGLALMVPLTSATPAEAHTRHQHWRHSHVVHRVRSCDPRPCRVYTRFLPACDTWYGYPAHMSYYYGRPVYVQPRPVIGVRCP
jgi:hypothetical protein